VGISRDYPLKTQTSKQPIGEVLGYEIIPSHPLKYPRSKQALTLDLPLPLPLHLPLPPSLSKTCSLHMHVNVI
jgi:hypothetical protein